MRYLIFQTDKGGPFLADFFWQEGTTECVSIYSMAELETKISNLTPTDKNAALYEAALQRLRIANAD